MDQATSRSSQVQVVARATAKSKRWICVRLAAFGANSIFSLCSEGDTTHAAFRHRYSQSISIAPWSHLKALKTCPGRAGNKVTVTSTAPGLFDIAFNSFGNQSLLAGASQVGPTPTQIGTTVRLPGNATAAQIESAIERVSQVDVTVTGGVRRASSPSSSMKMVISRACHDRFFHETQNLDVYASAVSSSSSTDRSCLADHP